LFIDDSKLHDGITDLIREFQRSKQEHQNECLQKVDDTITIAPIDCDTAKYPALQQFAVPLVNTTIHSLLCEIVALYDNDGNLLTFQAFHPSRPASSANSRALLQMKDLVTLILSMRSMITSSAKMSSM
jgi:hypothetical protein